MPLTEFVMPLYVVTTVQDEPLTERVEVIPIAETIPSGWQAHSEPPASSMLEQHVVAPLLPPLLLLLHAATRPTNSTTHADVIRFIDFPLSTVITSISSVRRSRHQIILVRPRVASER